MREATAATSSTFLLIAFAFPAGAVGQTPFLGQAPTVEDLPAIGHRYHGLTRAERAALRPAFRLPLRALFESDSAEQLLSAAVVEPLPDPGRPLLPAPADPGSSGDPFSDNKPTDEGGALGALGELFAMEAELLRASGRDVAATGPVSSAEEEPYQPPREEESSPEPEADDDPFASSDEPEDDPFGF